ncbi:MAG: tol-pal system YbgF family protein [Sulfuricurvum sp.]
MSFAFLHPEFFVWMIPPMAVLFYFWQTQKSREYHYFSDETVRKLRAPEITMGLKGRNVLFLLASLLMIAAMAQPVMIPKGDMEEGRADILIVLDLSKKSAEAFEKEKEETLDLIRRLEGERIAIVGISDALYRISPSSIDVGILIRLVQGLHPEILKTASIDTALMDALKDSSLHICIGFPPSFADTEKTVFYGEKKMQIVYARIAEQKRARMLYAHIPLFPYPLGLAMLLIWIALSSMSKRRTVPLTAFLLMLTLPNLPLHAGLLDFRILQNGYAAYERGEYDKSAAYFKEYQSSHDSPEIRYNLANALYRAGKYEAARYWYRRVYTDNILLAERAASNLVMTEKQIEAKQGSRQIEGVVSHVSVEHARVSAHGLKTETLFRTRLYRIP